MRHLILTGVIALFAAAPAEAVSWHSLSVSPEIAFPVGDMRDKAGYGVGISGRFEVVKAWSLIYGFGAGYLSFSEKGPDESRVEVLPLEGIVRHRFGGGLFYCALQVGAQLRETHDLVNGTENEIRPTLSPALGMFIPLGDMTAADVTALFAALPQDAQYFGIRISAVLGM